MVTELERFRQRERERISERRTLATAREGMLRERAAVRDIRAKAVGGFFTSVPGMGVRKAFGGKAPKKKKGKKKAKGTLAESPGNILVDRPVRNPFLR